MPTPPFNALYAEHEVILRCVDRLQKLFLAPALSAHATELGELLGFFREYGDGYHHQKEEHVLFPALRNLNGGMDMLIESLTDHHELFREELGKAGVELAAGQYAAFEERMRRYAQNLVDHIGAENDELFVAADDILSHEDIVKLGHRFEDADRDRGEARKRELEAIG
jgi:hemerythrin-like domain-containing protein